MIIRGCGGELSHPFTSAIHSVEKDTRESHVDIVNVEMNLHGYPWGVSRGIQGDVGRVASSKGVNVTSTHLLDPRHVRNGMSSCVNLPTPIHTILCSTREEVVAVYM